MCTYTIKKMAIMRDNYNSALACIDYMVAQLKDKLMDMINAYLTLLRSMVVTS